MDNKVIGLRIEQRRTQLGFTQEFVANEIGVAKSTIQRYEKGSISKIKLPVVDAIARVLNVNPAWLCGKSDVMQFEYSQQKTVTIDSDGLDELDMKFVQMIKQLSDQEKQMLIAQMEGLLRTRGQ